MKKRLLTISVLTLLALLPWTTHTGTAATTYEITRISQTPDGWGSNGHAGDADLSGDGRYVAFCSLASNLVTGDTNGSWDQFVYDRLMNEMTRIVADSINQPVVTIVSVISADGRYVAFVSEASHLVAGDINNATDVFIHDRQTSTTTLVSIATNGMQGNGHSLYPALSADERYVAFVSFATNLIGAGDTNGVEDVFVQDRHTGTTTRVSVATGGVQGEGSSSNPAISGDGRYVAFASLAGNLVPGDDNGVKDVFVHDRQTGETTIVSVSSAGVQGNSESYQPTISGDGRYVTFYSRADSLVMGDTNNISDAFLHDRETGTTTRISVAADGTQIAEGWSVSPAEISADGRWLTFSTNFANMIPGEINCRRNVFLYERETGQVTQVTHFTDKESFGSALSADGSALAFISMPVPMLDYDYVNVFLWAPTMSRYQVFLPLAVQGN